MTSINNTMKAMSMPQNCEMKGMHQSHANNGAQDSHGKKVGNSDTQPTAKVNQVRNERIGNVLDVRV